jgi:hypothetical protein
LEKKVGKVTLDENFNSGPPNYGREAIMTRATIAIAMTDACISMATTPLQQGQQTNCNDGEDTCGLMMTTMPLQQGISVMPNNCVCHWTGWVEVASPPEGERATLVILVWFQTLASFF